VTPRVSVCVPAYQSAAHLQEVLDAVYAQDFEDFELVVVDDGSTDDTPRILAAQTDPRLRFTRRERNLGQEATVAETVARARADLVKFLDADDILHRDCLTAMVAALDSHPAATIAFSRREVIVEESVDPDFARRWLAEHGDMQAAAGRIDAVSDGRALLRRYLADLRPVNWIAEPAGVIARRADLIAVGGYNRRVRQNNDMDLWLRLMARGEAVFVDRALYDYRLAITGVTGASTSRERQWLDLLWTVEGLDRIDGFPEAAAVREARRHLVRRALRRLAATARRDPAGAAGRLADLAAYGRYRAACAAGRGAPLYQPIPL
jgi:glycosyltransferase involved in cell wall biosynthesis